MSASTSQRHKSRKGKHNATATVLTTTTSSTPVVEAKKSSNNPVNTEVGAEQPVDLMVATIDTLAQAFKSVVSPLAEAKDTLIQTFENEVLPLEPVEKASVPDTTSIETTKTKEVVSPVAVQVNETIQEAQSGAGFLRTTRETFKETTTCSSMLTPEIEVIHEMQKVVVHMTQATTTPELELSLAPITISSSEPAENPIFGTFVETHDTIVPVNSEELIVGASSLATLLKTPPTTPTTTTPTTTTPTTTIAGHTTQPESPVDTTTSPVAVPESKVIVNPDSTIANTAVENEPKERRSSLKRRLQAPQQSQEQLPSSPDTPVVKKASRKHHCAQCTKPPSPEIPAVRPRSHRHREHNKSELIDSEALKLQKSTKVADPGLSVGLGVAENLGAVVATTLLHSEVVPLAYIPEITTVPAVKTTPVTVEEVTSPIAVADGIPVIVAKVSPISIAEVTSAPISLAEITPVNAAPVPVVEVTLVPVAEITLVPVIEITSIPVPEITPVPFVDVTSALVPLVNTTPVETPITISSTVSLPTSLPGTLLNSTNYQGSQVVVSSHTTLSQSDSMPALVEISRTEVNNSTLETKHNNQTQPSTILKRNTHSSSSIQSVTSSSSSSSSSASSSGTTTISSSGTNSDMYTTQKAVRFNTADTRKENPAPRAAATVPNSSAPNPIKPTDKKSSTVPSCEVAKREEVKIYIRTNDVDLTVEDVETCTKKYLSFLQTASANSLVVFYDMRQVHVANALAMASTVHDSLLPLRGLLEAKLAVYAVCLPDGIAYKKIGELVQAYLLRYPSPIPFMIDSNEAKCKQFLRDKHTQMKKKQ